MSQADTATQNAVGYFAWVDPYNNPAPNPPSELLVQIESGPAIYNGYGTGGSVSASVTDNIGGSLTNDGDGLQQNNPPAYYSVLNVPLNGIVSVNLTSKFSAAVSYDGTGSANSTHWSYVVDGLGATPIPVTLQLSGTTPDTTNTGQLDILVGQQCQASVPAIGQLTSAGYNVAYQWSVSGINYLDWEPTTPQIGTAPANPNSSYYVPGPGTTTNSTYSWYWNDPGSGPAAAGATPPPSRTNETVTCVITATVPANSTLPPIPAFTLTQTVNVITPTAYWTVDPAGYFTGCNPQPNVNNPSFPTEAFGAETIWSPVNVTLANAPAGTLPTTFSGGQFCLAQVITNNTSATRTVQPPSTSAATLYGQLPVSGGYSKLANALDAPSSFAFPDSYIGNPASGSFTFGGPPPPWSVGTAVTSGDLPSINPYYLSTTPLPIGDTGERNWTAEDLADSFSTWLMYQPPTNGKSIWVPLLTGTWSVNAEATVNNNGTWTVNFANTATEPPGNSTILGYTELIPALPKVTPASVTAGTNVPQWGMIGNTANYALEPLAQ